MWVDAVKHSLSILSLRNYSVVTWLYPAAVLVTKFIIITEIIFLRKIKRVIN